MLTPTSEHAPECPLAGALAEHLRESCRPLTARWLERISARVALDPNRVFPTNELLDHMPLLILGIADFLENPAAEVSADSTVIAQAMELGSLRHSQGFDVYEILKQYELLGNILFSDLAKAADAMPEPCEKSELLVCGQRLFRSVSIIQQATTTQYIRMADERVAERESRLRAFNRAVSHELKNSIGGVIGASELLRTVPDLTEAKRDRLLAMVSRHGRAMQRTIDNLIALSRLETDVLQHRHIRLPEAATEAGRQLREAAVAAGVAVIVAEDLPDVEVNAAAVELCLTNYISNALKYSDQSKPERHALVQGAIELTERGRMLVVRVRDNGLGVPEEKRAQLFHRFFRAHETVTGIEGTGLGLSIVRDTVESLGGQAWAEFHGDGSTFAFSLPLSRDEVQPAPQVRALSADAADANG